MRTPKAANRLTGACRLLLLGLFLVALCLGPGSAQAAYLHPAQTEVFGPEGTDTGTGFGSGTVPEIRFDQNSKRLYVLRPHLCCSSAPQVPRGIYAFDMQTPGVHTPLAGGFPIPLLEPSFNPFIGVDESEGNIYYLDGDILRGPPFGTLYGFDSQGNPLGGDYPETLTDPQHFSFAGPIAVDPLGYLWMGGSHMESCGCSTTEPQLLKFDPSGVFLGSVFAAHPFIAEELSFDRYTGDLWALGYFEGEGGAVARFTAASGYTQYDRRFAAEPFEIRGGMAVDAKHGVIYLTPNYAAEIVAYNETGARIETYATGGTFANGEFVGSMAVNEETGELYYVDKGPFGDEEPVGSQIHVLDGVVVPDVTTGSPSAIGHTTITATGHVDPAGGPGVTECKFEYGTTTAYSLGSVPCVPAATPGSPLTSGTDVEAQLSGLTAGLEYHYRLVASNSNGTNLGNDETASTQPSVVKTGDATNVQRTGATLNGTVDPEGESTTFYFEYGKTKAYGQTEAPPPGEPVGTTAAGDQPVSKAISGLEAGTTYHYRLVAINGKGRSVGSDRTFATSPAVKDLSTDPATGIARTGATLNGTLDPDGLATSYYFEWGKTRRYGQASAAPPGTSLGTTTPGDQHLSALAEGLQPATTYHYRLVASNPTYGTTYGNDRTFTTLPAVIGLATNPATSVEPTAATLNGELDPDGIATTYYFQWGKTPFYGHNTAVPPGLDAGTTSPGELALSAQLEELEPGTTYHYRLAAHNSYGTTFGADQSFSTPQAPSIEGVFSASVTAESAELKARINPNGTDPSFETHYRFEYGTTTGYGQSAPVPGGTLAPASGGQNVTVPVSGLSEVTYHFRLVAENSWGTATSEDQTFDFKPPASCPNAAVRQQTGAAYLPDCRAYEMVSPGRANGARLWFVAPYSPYALNEMAYVGAVNVIPGAGDPPNSQTSGDIYVATRTNTGWNTHYVGLSANEVFAQAGAPDSEAHGPSGTLSDSSMTKFLTWAERSSGDRSYAPYMWDNEGNRLGRLPTNAEEVPGGAQTVGEGGFVGAIKASADFSHYAFSSRNVAFAPGGLTSAPGSAYDNDVAAKSVTLISKTPSGADIPQDGAANAGSSEYIRIPAISKDSSHILMSTAGPNGSTHLYMRVDDAVSYEVSKGEDGINHGVTLAGMTEDGREVFFTTAARMTADDHDTSIDLYRWAENGGAPALTRISKGTEGSGDSDSCNAGWITGCGVEVVPTDLYVVNQPGFASERYAPIDTSLASESGEIYFYSPEELEGARGIPGKRNLYVWRSGKVQHVATLDPLGFAERINVTPSGAHMAFTTKTKIGAYENAGHAEMYTYDPAARKLTCVSCLPDGSAATSDVQGAQNGIFLTDDGRAFFSTADALVARDANGIPDVYEYVGGRAQLITTGTGDTAGTESGREAGLIGVSANGIDAFFSTYQTLVPTDENGPFFKFYVARTNGGFPYNKPAAPCAAADECHGEGSSSPPEPTIGSGADVGSGGNVAAVRRRHRHRKHAPHHRRKHGHRRGRGRSGR